MLNYKKYKRFETIELKDRKWPNNTINKAPIWCSVDLQRWKSSINKSNDCR